MGKGGGGAFQNNYCQKQNELRLLLVSSWPPLSDGTGIKMIKEVYISLIILRHHKTGEKILEICTFFWDTLHVRVQLKYSLGNYE